tara:strand:- start:2711 stop:3253 length:543 start_codon:yes stop_codon:yes gene_type:complete
MNKIGKVKLGINNELDVVIVSDVSMNGEADKDDLYFVMFNIMHEPLRLSVTTVGDLLTLAKINTEKSEEELLKLLESDPEQYVYSALGNTELLMENSQEKIKIPLDSAESATKARIIISSMIDKKRFIQESNYNVDGKITVKKQEVETENMIPQLRIMLEIIKNWDNLDLEELEKRLAGQ